MRSGGRELSPARAFVAAIAIVVGMTVTPAAVARTQCSFTLGFKALHDLLPDVVGDCLESEQVDPATGDLTQRTVNGLLMWRKADNWTAFTDGPNTYIARPEGVITRPTDGLKFPWERDVPPPVAQSGAQGSASARVPESVLVREDFDDPGVGLCSWVAAASRPDLIFRCVDGEMRMSGVSAPEFGLALRLPSLYANASVAVDARLVMGFEQRFFVLHCRENAERNGGYALWVMPALQRFVMGRNDDTEWKTLVGPATSEAIKPGGETNRFELSCIGDTVTGRANGVDLGSLHDGTYLSGYFRVRTQNGANVPLPIDARLDNLVVTER